MGLSKAALRFIAIEHHRKPFAGSAVMLGRQCVYGTFSDVQQILREEQIPQAKLPPGLDTSTNIPDWRGTENQRFTSDAAFFYALGVQDVRALDVSDFEGAEIIWDLNRPVDSGLEGRFDLILDSGTLEHVFDVKTAMTNLARMLRPGGRVIHFSPANNFCNHGFYQFSPTFFADFYLGNQFRDVRVYIAEESVRTPGLQRLELFEFHTSNQPCMMASPMDHRLLVYSVAEKGSESTADQVPVQSYYAAAFAASKVSAEAKQLAEELHIPSSSAARLAKQWLPMPAYLAMRSSWLKAQNWFAGPSEIRKPWGLKMWKRLH